MFVYEKKLQYPVKIANPNPKYAQIIISQYGGPDGELGASLRYLSQRYSMPFPELKGLLTDVGIEDLFCAFKYLYSYQSYKNHQNYCVHSFLRLNVMNIKIQKPYHFRIF